MPVENWAKEERKENCRGFCGVMLPVKKKKIPNYFSSKLFARAPPQCVNWQMVNESSALLLGMVEASILFKVTEVISCDHPGQEAPSPQYEFLLARAGSMISAC
jgi:hypothetical protein